MDDSDKKDERPAARPKEPRPMSKVDIFNASEAKRKEGKIEQHRRESLQLKEFMRVKGKVLLGVFAIALVALTVWLSNSDFGSGTFGDMGKFECEQAVKSQLRSPSTASVDFLTNSQSSSDSGNWKHTGTVTAQNGFGAMVTNGWTCYFEGGVARATVG